LLLSLGAVYLLACAGCAAWQRRMIYFPPVMDSATVARDAARAGLEPWNNSSGQRIGWKRLASAQPAKGRILILHGNGGTAFWCAHYADVIQQVGAYDILIVEYPGYADRPGKPSERTLDESAEEAFQSLGAGGPTYLLGESLGTGVATYLAGKHPDEVAGVVLLGPYNRLADVGQSHIKIFPVRWILIDQFPSEDYLRTYHGPVAMVVAAGDTVVPAKFGHRLYDRYAGPKRMWEFPGVNHDAVMSQPVEVWRQIIEFLQTNPSGARTASSASP
jgi:pimeloyl-ACP methyl ester carboxylesterase